MRDSENTPSGLVDVHGLNSFTDHEMVSFITLLLTNCRFAVEGTCCSSSRCGACTPPSSGRWTSKGLHNYSSLVTVQVPSNLCNKLIMHRLCQLFLNFCLQPHVSVLLFNILRSVMLHGL